MAGNQNKQDDPYARDSFSMRRMTRGQVWAITIVAIIIVVALVAYSYS